MLDSTAPLDQTRDQEMLFEEKPQFKTQKEKVSEHIKGLSAGQLEVLSVQLSKIKHTEMSKYHAYWCFTLLVLISVVNTFQRSTIQFMFTF